MTKEQKKQYLASLSFCRSYLRMGGMLTDTVNKQIHEKIRKYQDKNKIEITSEELNKPKIVYE